MQRFKFMYKQFLREPLWFKIWIGLALVVSIVFSSSSFADVGHYQSISKVAAAVILGAYGFKLRRIPRVSIILYVLAGLSLYLAWDRY